MNKKVLLLSAFILLMVNVSAWTNSTFNNSLSAENLTFSVINFKGYSTVPQVIDFNYTTYNSSSNDIFVNFTRIANTTGGANLSWTGTTTRATGGTAYCKNQTSGSFISLGDMFTLGVQNGSAVMPIQCLSNPTIETKFSIVAPDNCGLCSGVEYFREVDINTSYLYSNTRYLSIPSSVSAITNAYINLSGFAFQDFVQGSGSGTTITISSLNNITRLGQKVMINNRNITRAGFYVQESGSPNQDINVTIRKVSDNSIIQTKVLGNRTTLTSLGTITFVNFTSTSNINEEVYIMLEWYNQTPAGSGYRILTQNSGGTCDQLANQESWQYGSTGYSLQNGGCDVPHNFTYTDTGLSSNMSLLTYSSSVWNYVPLFSQQNNRTSNFASTLTRYLTSQYLVGSNYLIPFIFTSQTVGVIQYSSMLFSNEGFLENAITYSASDYETANSSFILNISYDTSRYTTSSANLIYNGTYYSTTQNIVGSNSIFTRNINLPIVRNQTGSYDTNSFYWSVALSNSTTTEYYNSTTNTQQVLKTDIVICNSTYQNFSLINFTTKSATSNYPNKNATIKISWDWNLGNGTSALQRNSSYQDLSETNYTWNFCSNVNANFTVDAQIQYDATGFAPNNYYLENAVLIPNQTNQITLYLLNDSLATLTQFLVQTPAQQGIQNVIIQVQMYDVGLDQFFLVSMMKTSYAGTDISYLNWYDTFYKFILLEDGEVIKSVEPNKISESPQIITIFPDNVFTFEKFRDFQYSLTYNNATQNFVLTYTKPSGLVTAACMRVVKRSISNETTLSEQCNTASSGTIYYNIASDGNGTFVASFYATGSFSPIDWLSTTIGGELSDTIHILLGEDAPVYAIMFSAVTLGAMFFNPVLGVIAILLSMLGASALGFTNVSFATYIGLVLIGGIVILFIRR